MKDVPMETTNTVTKFRINYCISPPGLVSFGKKKKKAAYTPTAVYCLADSMGIQRVYCVCLFFLFWADLRKINVHLMTIFEQKQINKTLMSQYDNVVDQTATHDP